MVVTLDGYWNIGTPEYTNPIEWLFQFLPGVIRDDVALTVSEVLRWYVYAMQMEFDYLQYLIAQLPLLISPDSASIETINLLCSSLLMDQLTNLSLDELRWRYLLRSQFIRNKGKARAIRGSIGYLIHSNVRLIELWKNDYANPVSYSNHKDITHPYKSTRVRIELAEYCEDISSEYNFGSIDQLPSCVFPVGPTTQSSVSDVASKARDSVVLVVSCDVEDSSQGQIGDTIEADTACAMTCQSLCQTTTEYTIRTPWKH
jgi:hypothetical protein